MQLRFKLFYHFCKSVFLLLFIRQHLLQTVGYGLLFSFFVLQMASSSIVVAFHSNEQVFFKRRSCFFSIVIFCFIQSIGLLLQSQGSFSSGVSFLIDSVLLQRVGVLLRSSLSFLFSRVFFCSSSWSSSSRSRYSFLYSFISDHTAVGLFAIGIGL